MILIDSIRVRQPPIGFKIADISYQNAFCQDNYL